MATQTPAACDRIALVNPIVYAIPIFMLTILAEAAIAHGLGRRVYNLADAITSLNFGILSQVSAAFSRVLGLGVYMWVFEHGRWLTLPSDALWVWVAALIAYDFLYYWVHRCGHEVELMWAAHQVHHSSEYFNLSTALRQTSTGVLFSWPFYLPMALLGVPPVVFAVVALIDLLYQYGVHTELVGKLGTLDRILVTPSNHRVHHGQNDYCIDRNYGGILIIWDRLFGTFAEERDLEPVVYGIRKPLNSFNAIWGNLNVFDALWRRCRHASSLWQAIQVWFARPTTVAALQQEPIHRERLQSRAPNRLQYYVVVQYALLAVIATYFFAITETLNALSRTGYALWIIGSVWSLGALLEQRAYAKILEGTRWLLSLGMLVLV
jgi:alkylglycerol monooxygenase